MTELRDRAVAIYDAFTHEHRDRRTLLREMTLLAGSAAAAEALILGIGAAPAAAAIVDPADKRLTTRRLEGAEAGKPSAAYVATPRAGRRLGTVLVVHENRGLNAHIEDVARRIALAGFHAVAPDLLAPQGGTPVDEDQARTLIGSVDYDLALAQATAMLRAERGRRGGSGKAGVVGFCWGGAFVNRLAVAAGTLLDAGVSYYGPAPASAEAGKVSAALMLHFAGKDARVNATGEPWAAALKDAGKPVEAFTYAGVDHAFNNDTSAERYNAAAATLAWARTTRFLHQRLDA